MTESERVLPLFPLEQVVLFPGMSLPLHIFEERYKVMIGACQVTDQLFGVLLIKTGTEVGAPAQPERVGSRVAVRGAAVAAQGARAGVAGALARAPWARAPARAPPARRGRLGARRRGGGRAGQGGGARDGGGCRRRPYPPPYAHRAQH